MKLDVVLSSNSDHTAGFATVTGFVGSTTTVDLMVLKQAIKALVDFTEKGLTPAKLIIGVEESSNHEGMIIFFLDKEQKTGIALAPLFAEAVEQ